MGRPLGILAFGLLLAIGGGVAILPESAAGSFVLMLGVIVIGVLITVIAGFKGRKADANRALARQSRLLITEVADREEA